MRVSVVGILLNITLSFVFVRVLDTGIAGLPLAASVASTFMAAVLALLLNKKYRIFDKSFIINLLKLIISALAMTILMLLVSTVGFGGGVLGKILAFLIPSAVGFVMYVTLVFILKTDEARMVLKIFKKRSDSNEQ